MQSINLLAQASSGGGMSQFVFIGLLFVMMYVVVIRPQQKQRKELKAKQDGLKTGDKVVTIGGMHGAVNSVSEKTVSLRIADNVFVKFDRSAIATVVAKKDEADS